MIPLYFDPILNRPRQKPPLPFWGKLRHFFDPWDESTLTRTTMADFNGTSNYLTATSSASMAISNGKMSAAWKANRRKCYPGNNTTGRVFLARGNGPNAGGGGFVLYEGTGGIYDNNELHMAISTNSTGTAGFECGTANGVTLENFRDGWTTYGVSVDLTEASYLNKVKFYRDGVLVSTGYYSNPSALASTMAFQASTANMQIGAGRYSGAAYGFMNGGMRDVLYAPGVTWTASEHLAFHNSGTRGPSLCFDIPCTESSGTRSDVSGNGNHFSQSGGAQGVIYPVTAWRCRKTGKAFVCDTEGKAPVWEAAGWRGHPCVRGHNEIFGALLGTHTNFYRTSGANDIFSASAWGSIITSSEAGEFGVTLNSDDTKYMFTSQSRATHRNGSDITDKSVPGLRYRDTTTPNEHVYMDVASLTAGQAYTSHWRLLRTGSGLSRFAAEFDGSSVSVASNAASADAPVSPNTFGEIPASGNDKQGLLCFPTGSYYQGTNGMLATGGIAMHDDMTDAEAAYMSDFWETRMAA